jgi:hypothetical protein
MTDGQYKLVCLSALLERTGKKYCLGSCRIEARSVNNIPYGMYHSGWGENLYLLEVKSIKGPVDSKKLAREKANSLFDEIVESYAGY